MFKGMKSPLAHNDSKRLIIDMFPLGVVRMLEPTDPWVDLLFIVFAVTLTGKSMCLPIATAGAVGAESRNPILKQGSRNVTGDAHPAA